ncbi:MAG: cardiolipin synthase [Verrucomicrobiae bacterium]|nr:cardiolipin synthase [Verrucomicrobiae bacterium]
MFEQFSEKAVVGTLIFLSWEIFAIATIVNIVMKARSAPSAWGWSMAVLALPFFAVPLYWILGRYQFRGYLERLREARSNHEEAYRDHLVTMEPHYAELEGDEIRYAGVLERLTERRFTRGNEVCLLIDGDQTFEAIFKAIESAESYILVQFFIVKDDGLGNRFRELLERKSRAGVRVYFVYDEIGSHQISKSYIRSLQNAGVEFHPFHSTQGPSNRFQINFRNHRKIVIVDGRVGFVGGHNIGDEYLGLSKRFGPWRDTHVQLNGPCVLSLQMVFLGDYYWATRQVPELNWTTVIPADGSGCGGGDATVLTLPTGPVGPIEGGTIFFLNAITRARERFWVATPYFVTDESIRSALQMAALRGVDVRIMIPDHPDKRIPWLATFSILDEMEAAGVRIFRYEIGFLHQKVLVVDELFAGVGTANLDNRSMRLNFEVTAVVLCRDFARQVAAMLEVDFARCREVGASDYSSRPWWFRLAVRVARLFSPVL